MRRFLNLLLALAVIAFATPAATPPAIAAAAFTGGSGYSLNGDATSISFRMKTTQSTSNVVVVGQHDAVSSGSGWSIIMNNVAGKLTFQAKRTTGQVIGVVGSATVNDGVWHDIVLLLRYDNTATCELWVDGVLDSSGTSSQIIWGGNTNPRIARAADTFWASYVGEIAEFKGHDHRLTADEINALHAGFSPGRVTRGLVYYLPLIRTATDQKGSTITAIGTPTVTDHPRVIGGP